MIKTNLEQQATINRQLVEVNKSMADAHARIEQSNLDIARQLAGVRALHMKTLKDMGDKVNAAAMELAKANEGHGSVEVVLKNILHEPIFLIVFEGAGRGAFGSNYTIFGSDNKKIYEGLHAPLIRHYGAVYTQELNDFTSMEVTKTELGDMGVSVAVSDRGMRQEDAAKLTKAEARMCKKLWKLVRGAPRFASAFDQQSA